MARTPRKSTAKPTRRRRSAPVEQPPVTRAEVEEETVEQLLAVINTLRAQVNGVRNAFFRLANVRAADMVLHQGKSWDDGAAYINAEMQGLDAAIQSVAQNGAAT